MPKYTIEYRLEARAPRLFCGSGTGRRGVDRTFLRDAVGRIVVPGSHMKGLVRQQCENLLETLGRTCADPHDRTRTVPADSLLARTFGLAGPADLVCVFSDLTVVSDRETDREPADGAVRARIAMHRRLGRPIHGALFDTDYGVLDGDLCGSIQLWADGASPPPQLTLLCAGLHLVEAVGGDSSTGAGLVRAHIASVTRAGDAIDVGEILAPLGDEAWLDAGGN